MIGSWMECVEVGGKREGGLFVVVNVVGGEG